MIKNRWPAMLLASVAMLACEALRADQIVFKNGDKLTGKIISADGGKMKIATKVAGEITVDMSEVATFSTDEPIEIKTSGGATTRESVESAETSTVKPAATTQPLAIAEIKQINPPEPKWTGSVIVNGALARGNTNTDDLGVSADGELRRQTDTTDDRFSFGAAYNFGRQRDPATGDHVTTTDNWFALGKYERFWTEKFYTYGLMKTEHDRIAELNYRLSPGVGIGYKWIAKPDINFTSEAGVTYVYENYTSDDTDEHVALRLAYHFDKKLNERVNLFHNLEYLPAFDDPGDYNLTTDAGIRVDLTQRFFTEVKAEWKRDSTPAVGAEKNDLRYVLGIGWKF